ncbi:MAG: M28 family peptidase, partial [Bacteroidota bacterium]
DEPLASAETSLLPTEDGAPSAWSTNLFQKIRAAFQAGAPRGILIVGDTGPRAPESLAAEAAIAMEGAAKPQGSVSLEPPAAGLAYPPLFVISSELADQLLASTGRTVAELKADIDADLQPTVLAVEDARVSSRLTFETVPLGTENVVAYIEGSDPVLKDEVVVLSAHYDHIGIKPGTEGDRINNGADDDGSGTVALLEIAEAFQTAKENGHGPRRSVVFLNVSGEEKGLLGSAYYADTEPLFPLEQTVANLNIDMIGRYDPTHPTGSENYVYIIGSNLISQELHDLNLRVNEVTGIGLELDERFNSKDDPNQFYRRSDHWNFGKHGIPFIFFFTGTHEDYHDVGDEPQKIDYDRLARITRLVFGTAWQVANQDDPPAVSGTGFN